MAETPQLSFEDLAPSLRRAVERWPSAGNLQEVYRDLKATYGTAAVSVVELCNGFTECVAKTILRELGKQGEVTGDASPSDLLAAALKSVGAKTSNHGGEVSRVISGHNKIAQALGAWRNREGAAAHGKDGWMATITENHLRVFVLSTDALVAILLAAYEGKGPDVRYSREEPERFAHLNEQIDQAVTAWTATDVDEDGTIVVAFGDPTGKTDFDPVEVRVSPSHFLFHTDREAYASLLSTASQMVTDADTEEDDEPDKIEESTTEGSPVTTGKTVVRTRRYAVEALKQAYAGRFAPATPQLVQKLKLVALGVATDVLESCVFTILAELDRAAPIEWHKRESTIAEVSVLIDATFELIGVSLTREHRGQVVDLLADEIGNK